MGPDAIILVFWLLSFKPIFSLTSFIKRLFSSSSLFAIRVVSSAYLRLLIFLLAFLIPTCALSSLVFCMVYYAYSTSNAHNSPIVYCIQYTIYCILVTIYNILYIGNNIQPWHTRFPILNQSNVPCLVLTVASWPAYYCYLLYTIKTNIVFQYELEAAACLLFWVLDLLSLIEEKWKRERERERREGTLGSTSTFFLIELEKN